MSEPSMADGAETATTGTQTGATGAETDTTGTGASSTDTEAAGDGVGSDDRRTAHGINSGPGRVLIAVYLLFAIAASSRAGYQLGTKYAEAPLAYLLSALAAVIYIVATVGLSRAGRVGRRIAFVSCTVELVGVLTVGAASQLVPSAFPDDTVWSGFGEGYGYVPLVLPILGLLWLRRTAH